MAAIDYRAIVAVRGYQPAYSAGLGCPGCGHGAWHVGRQSAECARCGTALPLAPTFVGEHPDTGPRASDPAIANPLGLDLTDYAGYDANLEQLASVFLVANGWTNQARHETLKGLRAIAVHCALRAGRPAPEGQHHG